MVTAVTTVITAVPAVSGSLPLPEFGILAGQAWGIYVRNCVELTPRSTVILEELAGFQPVKKFPAFHGTRRSVTAFTTARHLSLSWASSIQSIPSHPTSRTPILILSFHLRFGLPSGLFPSGLPTKPLYTTLLSPIRTTFPAHLSVLDWITRTLLGEQYRSLRLSRCRVCSARGVTRTVLFKCVKCDVALCVDRSCFEDYHTKTTYKTHFLSFSVQTVGASTTMHVQEHGYL